MAPSESADLPIKKLRIGVGLPSYGGKVSAEHVNQWISFGHTLAASEQRFSLVMVAIQDVCGVDRARSALMDDAIHAGCDWLLMIDSDTWVRDGSDLLQMVSDADRADAAIVVAPVQRRTLNQTSELMVYMKDKAYTEDGLYFSDALRPATIEELQYRGKPLAQIEAAATAIMAINVPKARAALAEDKPWFRFTSVLSEDLDFCYRTRKAGGVIFCDPRVQTFHLNRPAILSNLGKNQ